MKISLLQVEDRHFAKSYLLTSPNQKTHQFNFSQSWMFDVWFNRILALSGVNYDREEKIFKVEGYIFIDWIYKISNISFSDNKHLNFSLESKDKVFHAYFFDSSEQKAFIEIRLQLIN